MRASVVLSALVAVLVGFGGTIALVVTAAQALGATVAETTSWVTAICLATAGSTLVLSVLHRMPIMAAWSTPGAAVIAATAGTVGMPSAVGAFLTAGALIWLTALIRPFGALVERIPTAVAAAMLAGVLIRFVIAVFEQAQLQPALVLPLVAIFLVARLVSPAGAVIATLAAGFALAAGLGLTDGLSFAPRLSTLVWIWPRFDPAVLIGLGVPLYLVTMAGQNLPGFAVLRASGYVAPSRSILAVTGIASMLIAPLGSHTANLGAITASICTGPDAHPDPAKRWLCGPVYAGGYLVLAAFGASLAALIAALPTALIAAIVGLALLSPLVNALGTALAEPRNRLAATFTLALTASGMTLHGIGSAFWGLLAGLVVLALQAGADRLKARRTTGGAASDQP